MTNDDDIQRRAAVQAVVAAEYPRVKRFIRSKVPEPDCYDVVQETMKAFVAADQGRVRNPSAFLFGIARNTVLTYFARHRTSTQPFDSTHASVADLGTSASTRFDRRNRLLHALRSLPLDHQTAFELRYAEELQLEEVAEVLGVSLATVKRYISSARTKLAELLVTGRVELDDGEAAQVADVYRSG